MFINIILWFLLMYGVMNIILDIWKNISCKDMNDDNVFITLVFKNDEDIVEDVVRSMMFKCTYLDGFNKIVAIDLNSTDKTGIILDKLQEDYECLYVLHSDGNAIELNNFKEKV